MSTVAVEAAGDAIRVIRLDRPDRLNALGKSMRLVDYVPCYRTEAGTGQGMAFAYWE